MGRHANCPRCRQRVVVRRASPLWWVALGGLTLFFTTMVAASSLIGPLILFAVPFMGMVGLAFGPIWEKCTEEPSCPRCSRVLRAAPTAREARLGRPIRLASPARA